MKKLKIYFLQTIDSDKKVLETAYPHIGLSYIASYLRENLKECENLELLIRNQSDEIDVIKENPDILAITSVTQNFNIAEQIIKKVKNEKNIPIILGGVHLTSLPTSLPKEVDVGVLGEGELTFYNLIKLYLQKNEINYADLTDFKGICFYDNNGKFHKTESQDRLDLNTLPLPARDLLPLGYQVLFTSRGCPYSCKFCSSSAFWHNIRFFSPEKVIEELNYILELDKSTKNIILYDDLFVADKNRLEQIADLAEKTGITKKVRFWGNATANLLDDRVCNSLNKLNFDGISFGFETGNEKMLKWLKGNQASIEKNKRAIQLCKKYNLESHGSFMLGLPDETEQQMRDTLNFIKNEDYDKGDILVCTPLPGTVFWDIAKQKKLVSDENQDWSKLSIRYSGWFPESDDFILMTDKVSYSIFREIYEECANEMLKRTKKFDERRAEQFASRVKVKDLFSKSNLARALKDPSRTFLYLQKIIKKCCKI